jgi:hypothetical protein
LNVSHQFYVSCLTAVMLLAQAICPPFAAACDCRETSCSHRQSGDSTTSCCCPTTVITKGKRSASPHCSHCKSQSPPTAQVATTQASCFCGGHSQQPLIPEGAPGSSHSVSLSWIDAAATTTRVVNVTEFPARVQLPRGEILTPNFRHVVLCVWLA